MKFLTTTLAAVAIAAVTAATAGANVDRSTVAKVDPLDAASSAAKPAVLIFAQRRGRCSEDLGYGRTGSYGCG